jgi:hypothetical protein
MCQIEELDLKSIEGKRKTSKLIMMYKLANGMVKVSKVCALSNQVEEHRKHHKGRSATVVQNSNSKGHYELELSVGTHSYRQWSV